MNVRGATAGLVAGVVALGVAFGVSSSSGPGEFFGVAVSAPISGNGRDTAHQLVLTLEYDPGWFGDGHDGSATIASNTSLTRDMHYTDLTINTGVTLNPSGFRVFATGTISGGTIARNGNNATSGGFYSLPGAVLSPGTLPGATRGGQGSTFGGICESANGVNPAPTSAYALAAISTASTAGGVGQGGSGGNGTGRPGCLVGASTFNPIFGDVGDVHQALTGRQLVSGVIFGAIMGGAGGGTADGTTNGGGGGGGGGYVVVGGRHIVNVAISAIGGSGYPGQSIGSGVTGEGGGGGGGAGGIIVVATTSPNTSYTTSVTGGSGGAAGGAGASNGGHGGDGRAIIFRVMQ